MFLRSFSERSGSWMTLSPVIDLASAVAVRAPARNGGTRSCGRGQESGLHRGRWRAVSLRRRASVAHEMRLRASLDPGMFQLCRRLRVREVTTELM